MKFKLTNTCFLFRKQHLMIIMRTFIFLFCTVVFSLVPNNLVPQNSKIKIEEDKTLTVDGVFKLIMDQTDYKFFYEKNLFKDFPVVHLKKGIIRTNELLKRSLSQGNLDITVTANKGILIKEKAPEIIKPQGIEISGTVTDKSGLPLVGANILEKGTSNGAQTDFDGNYSISVSNQDAVLIFSFIGFSTQEIPVGQSTTINALLDASAEGLDEVTIVAYGTQLKAKVTGSMATIKNDVLIDRPIISVAQGLAGVDPGTHVVISNNGGTPGESATISIRGEYANPSRPEFREPLVLVDGFESSMDDVDPNQIQEITILKDAAATSIYGVRAAEGVILITTKGGKRNAPVQFNYRYQAASQNYTSVPETLSTPEYMEFRNKAAYNEEVYRGNRNGDQASLDAAIASANRFSQFSESVINRAKNGEFYDTNWQDLLYSDTALQFSHSIDAYGGTEKTSYMISLGTVNQEGVNLADDSFERYNIRVKLDTDINDWLTIGTNTAYTQSTQNRVNVATANDEFRPSPLFPVTDEALGGTGMYVAGEGGVSGNPAMTSANGSNRRTNRDVLEMQLFGKIKIAKGFTFDQKLNYRVVNSNISAWNNNISYAEYTFDGQTGEYSDPNIVEESAARRNLENIYARSTHLTSQSLLNYKISLKDKHNFKALVGWQVEDIHNQLISAYREGFAVDALQQLTVAGTENWSNDSFASDNSYLSLIGRLNYDFKGKYLMEFSFRNDASSEFAPGNRSSFFPALSLGWNVASEPFMENLGFIDLFKLRGSIGETGSDDLPNSDPLAYYTRIGGTAGYAWPGGLQSGLVVSTYANQNLIWETVKKVDVGVDLSFWNGKFSLVADYYKNERTDQLVAIPAAREFGLGGTAPANIYASETKGFELKVGHRNEIGNVGINISLNAAHSKNEWTLRPGDNSWDNNEIGTSLRNPFGHRLDGFISNQEELDAYRAATSFGNGTQNRIWIGAPVLTENGSRDPETLLRIADSDGRIDNWDRVHYDNNGIYKVGSTIGVSYKGFSFTSVIDGTLGRNIAANYGASFGSGTGNILRAIAEESFDPETNNTDSAIFPIIFAGNWTYNAAPRITSSFVRVRNINLSYNFEKGFVPWIKGMKLYVSMENPFLIWDNNPLSKYGIDPELGSDTSQSTVYPISKTTTVGLNISF